MFAEFSNSEEGRALSSGRPCPGCRRPVATDQRYCLQCGHHLGGDRDELLAAVGLGDAATTGRSGAGADTDLQPAQASPLGSSTLGTAARRISPGVATTVVGFMLATGIAVGSGTTHRPQAPAGATPAELAEARAAVLAVIARRAATPPAVTAPTSAAPPVATSPTVAPGRESTTPETPVVTSSPTTRDASTAPSDDAATEPTPAATTPAATTPDPSTLPLPAIGNVWVISLPATSVDALNVASAPANVLRDAVAPQGVLLAGYSLLSQTAPANAIAAVSGQPPNLATEAGCVDLTEVPATSVDAKTGIVTGNGCVFPATVPSLAAQLTDGGGVVRTYDATAGAGCAGSPTAADPRSPLPYFHAFTDDPATCVDRAGDQARLTADLADPNATPKLSWIVAPDDASAAAEFTANTVAAITATAAYQAGGLILVLPDAPDPAATSDLAVGAVAISPFIPASTRNETAFGPYGVLRLIEDLFTLPALAGAGADDVPQIDRSIFQTKAAGARAHHQPTRSSS